MISNEVTCVEMIKAQEQPTLDVQCQGFSKEVLDRLPYLFQEPPHEEKADKGEVSSLFLGGCVFYTRHFLALHAPFLEKSGKEKIHDILMQANGCFQACAVAEGCGVLGLSSQAPFFCDETSSFDASVRSHHSCMDQLPSRAWPRGSLTWTRSAPKSILMH